MPSVYHRYATWVNLGLAITGVSIQLFILYPWHAEVSRELRYLELKDTEMKRRIKRLIARDDIIEKRIEDLMLSLSTTEQEKVKVMKQIADHKKLHDYIPPDLRDFQEIEDKLKQLGRHKSLHTHTAVRWWSSSLTPKTPATTTSPGETIKATSIINNKEQ
jgi:hypothetical protein